MSKIQINENDIRQMVNESVRKILKESYNDPNVVSYSSNIKEKVREYLDGLERSYGDNLEDCSNEFLKDVFNSGWAFFNSLSSFIHDDGQQEIYKY
jgi:actin-like ATPase involved in cell morphogenesis